MPSSAPVTASAWRSLRSVSSCACSSENILALGFEWKTEYSGFCSAVSCPHGAMPWLSPAWILLCAPRIHGELLKLGCDFNVPCPAISSACLLPERRQALGCFPSQSTRDHCGHGLLHRADHDVPSLVLFLRHRAWPTQDPPFQLCRNHRLG